MVESSTDGGATVESHRIAPLRNGIRISTTRRYGCVFVALHTAFTTIRRPFCTASLNGMPRNEGTRLLYRQRWRALHAGMSALIGRVIGGATVECPRIAPRRNSIRDRDSIYHLDVFSLRSTLRSPRFDGRHRPASIARGCLQNMRQVLSTTSWVAVDACSVAIDGIAKPGVQGERF